MTSLNFEKLNYAFFEFPQKPLKLFKTFLKKIHNYEEDLIFLLAYIARRFDEVGENHLIVQTVVDFYLTTNQHNQLNIIKYIDYFIHRLRPVKEANQSKTKNYMFYFKRNFVKMAINSKNLEKNNIILHWFKIFLEKWHKNELLSKKNFENLKDIIINGPK